MDDARKLDDAKRQAAPASAAPAPTTPTPGTPAAADGPSVPELLARRLHGPWSEAQAEHALTLLLSGALNDAQTGALLALVRPDTAHESEIVGAARAMRRVVTPVPWREHPALATAHAEGSLRLIDTCGTGGAAKTLNVSTGAAIVAASARVPGARIAVAKHGNRSRTGRGSAEVLAALGVNVDASPETQARCLEECGVCFCFAIHHHPAMRFAAGPRRALGFPTIFNVLGPLTNPAGATRQLIGVFDAALVEKVAHALARLGCERAIVAHGAGGLDELSTLGPTTIAHVDGPRVRTTRTEPAHLGLAPARVEDVTARDLDHAVAMLRAALAGEESPATDLVLANAGAALLVAGVVDDLRDGVSLARRAVAAGEALRTLDALARVSRAN